MVSLRVRIPVLIAISAVLCCSVPAWGQAVNPLDSRSSGVRPFTVPDGSEWPAVVFGLPPSENREDDGPPSSPEPFLRDVDTYYQDVDDTDGTALRNSLHELIDDHVRYDYTSSSTDTWDILEQADQDPSDSGQILDLYKNATYVKHGGGNNDYNREHSWPNSYGFPDDGDSNYPFTDCHHLFLCNIGYNGDRGNSYFDQCQGAGCSVERSTNVNNGTGGPGFSNWTNLSNRWQTWSGRKGDVARAQFYMDIRYEGGVHGGTGSNEPNLILTDNPALIVTTGGNADTAYMGLLSVLYQWHLEDPVDDLERNRNDVIYAYQGNRNPFIDHPEWAECAFFGSGCGGQPIFTDDFEDGSATAWTTVVGD